MEKKLNIGLGYGYSDINRNFMIREKDCPYIFVNHVVSDNEFNEAIDTIITYFMQRKLHCISIDLEERNNSYAPIKEMTLNEIEKVLGYKIKIINDKKE